MRWTARCAAIAAAVGVPAVRAEPEVYTDRAAFEAAVVVSIEEDFDGFFGSNPNEFSAVNFGSSSLTFFLPIVYAATNGGFAQLFERAYHSGDSAAAVIDGGGATAAVSLGGSYRAVGVDLLRAIFSNQADHYLVLPLGAGVVLSQPIVAPADSFFGIVSDVPITALSIQAITLAGTDGREVFDRITLSEPRAGCGPADLADPLGLLDLADVTAFAGAFSGGGDEADLAEPFGLLDLADVTAFVSLFLAGCP